MNKLNYDSKVIMLDLNFLEMRSYSLDNSLYTKKLLRELTANQNIIFLTDNTAQVASSLLDSFGIKSGFLISNGGSLLTNIANKKQISEGSIPKEIALQITYKCIWNNLGFSINTATTMFPYKMINSWWIKKYKSDLSHLYEYSKQELHTSEDIKKCIKENDIKNIEIYFLEDNDIARRKLMEEVIIEAIGPDKIDFSFNSSILNIVPKGFSKHATAFELSRSMNWNLEKSGLYCGIDQCESEICEKAYFAAINIETINKEDYNPSCNLDHIEIIPRGPSSWITWFYNNAHLWSGNEEESLKLTLLKTKKAYINLSEIKALKEGESKYINIDLSGNKPVKPAPQKKLILMAQKYVKKRKKFEEARRNVTRISFWPSQIPAVVNLLENKKSLHLEKYN